MSKEIQFDKRSECSAYVTVNGKVIYIDDSPATEGLFVHAWRERKGQKSLDGLVGDPIKLHETGDGIYTEAK